MIQPTDLHSATGAGVRVALIDSGVNAGHSHVGFLAGGIGFSLTDGREVQLTAEHEDRLGHGTALAGVLRVKAPQIELHAVKIFADRLAASIDVLDTALRWAIDQQMQLINLSLGTTNPNHRERLLNTVARANTAGTIVVASSPPQQVEVLPAALSGVIGVAGDERCGWADYRYVEGDPIPFRAHPCPRPLPGPAQAHNFRGHSFASAHVSALLALVVEKHPRLTVQEAREFLITYAGATRFPW
jgi:subtilisin family serine protease